MSLKHRISNYQISEFINFMPAQLQKRHFAFKRSPVVIASFLTTMLLMVIVFSGLSIAGEKNYSLPQVSYPNENPPQESKRILGKILFWDEQLSTDNSIACGSCHLPASGGADNRVGRFPGYDQQFKTDDDIVGSIGVLTRNSLGQPIVHPVFANQRQVTNRSSQSYFLGVWAKHNFWDGRATSEFIDPEKKTIAIKTGGALENQVLGPLMSSVEMAKQGQTPIEVVQKLSQTRPLALANKLPDDITKALVKGKQYPYLFEQAFGDKQISLKRIAFAIATYERSLIANQTPWDLAMAGQHKLGYQENLGFEFFKQSGCSQCHQPPLFTDNQFYNIGIQGLNADQGHQLISAKKQDAGAMKTPSLRNVALKTHFMHTGQFTSLNEVMDAYASIRFDSIASQLPNGEKYNFQFTEFQRKAIIAFLTNSLTDPRVQNETFPFDRPKLRSETQNASPALSITQASIKINHNNQIEISWWNPNQTQPSDIEIVRSDGHHFWQAEPPFIDMNAQAGQNYQYKLFARNALLKPSAPITLNIKLPYSKNQLLLIGMKIGISVILFFTFGSLGWLFIKYRFKRDNNGR